MEFLLQLVINGLAVGSIYALVALGFVVIYKSSGVLNFAQGELLLVGAYAFFAVAHHTHAPLWAALVATLVANLFYLTMTFYYFYVFATLAAALPVVFGRARGE